MNTVPLATGPIFGRVLDDFKKSLSRDDLENFRFTNLEDLKNTIEDLQNEQIRSRRMRNLTRLQVFLEGMEQYGKVIEVFVQTSEILAFVWGPIKWLLLTASTYSNAFNELLDTYQRIGEQIPLLAQYQRLFVSHNHMREILVMMYKDILDFHATAIKYFKGRVWRQIFDATWKSLKSTFGNIQENLRQHRSLIESQANIGHFEETQRSRVKMEAEFRALKDAEECRRLLAVNQWLCAADVEDDQAYGIKIRSEVAGSGNWLLGIEKFKSWFDEQYCSTPLLWLNGMPGAGKTILASLVIEEARKITKAKVAFFYCKYNDTARNTFVAVARGVLSQLLRQNRDLLPFFYERSSASGEVTLSSLTLAKELLKVALNSVEKVYVILDGIDECSRDDRKDISSFFCGIVEDLPQANFDSIHCLFVSQDDGFARKDFTKCSALKIDANDNKTDIHNLVRVWSERLQQRFELTDDRKSEIWDQVSRGADGMFLLAKLICTNLFAQTSTAKMNRELETGRFPRGIEEAYARITDRIFEQATHPQKEDILLLLGWLVCARRPLKWLEIQCAKSIDVENETVDLGQHRFRDDSKDLCGSLVEIRPNGAVELFHLTAKRYLIQSGIVVKKNSELDLAVLCIQYLNMPGFGRAYPEQSIEQLLLSGYYVFFDYSIVHWVRHLEEVLAHSENSDDLDHLVEALEIFIELHWQTPKSTLEKTKSTTENLKLLQQLSWYDKLESAVLATKKQIKSFTKSAAENDALDLSQSLARVRSVLEQLATLSSAIGNKVHEADLKNLYGCNLFRCPRLSCQFFYEGFQTPQNRDEHKAKHERAFCCTFENCPTADFGCVTAKELTKHMADYHGVFADVDREFPEEEKPKGRTRNFPCKLCPKKFARGYNLRAHLRTHTDERPFGCTVCGRQFARDNQRKRHQDLHSGEKKFVCKGVLDNGDIWGCGRRFSRGDALGRHFRSEPGRLCIRTLLEEEAAKNGYANRQLQPIVGPALSTEHAFGLPSSLLVQFPDLQNVDWVAVENGIDYLGVEEENDGQPASPGKATDDDLGS